MDICNPHNHSRILTYMRILDVRVLSHAINICYIRRLRWETLQEGPHAWYTNTVLISRLAKSPPTWYTIYAMLFGNEGRAIYLCTNNFLILNYTKLTACWAVIHTLLPPLGEASPTNFHTLHDVVFQLGHVCINLRCINICTFICKHEQYSFPKGRGAIRVRFR